MRPLRRLTAVLVALLVALAGMPALAAGQVCTPGAARYPQRPRAGVSLGVSYGVMRNLPGRRIARTATVWVPGHQAQVTRRVWIPGNTRQEWVPPLMQTRYDAWGRPYQVCVRAGHWRTVCDLGHYETRVEWTWVPGHWEPVRR